MKSFYFIILSLAAVARAQNAGSDYLLGPGDQFTVTVADLDAFAPDRAYRVDNSGAVTLPFAGHVHATGLTTAELEDSLKTRLNRVLKSPDVSVTITAFGSKSVSVLGSVNTPGILQLENGKNLVAVISQAGGLKADAGYLINITRDMQWGPLPLSGAHADSTGNYSIATVRVKNILNGADSGENIPIMPGDTISVPPADVVYVVGSVVKSGGFALNEHETLSALQVVALAEGLQRTAAADKAKILRLEDGKPDRAEIPVDLKGMLAGRGTDINLRAGDILFVPNSAAKSAGLRTIDAIVNAATGVAIYGRY